MLDPDHATHCILEIGFLKVQPLVPHIRLIDFGGHILNSSSDGIWKTDDTVRRCITNEADPNLFICCAFPCQSGKLWTIMWLMKDTLLIRGLDWEEFEAEKL